MKIRKIILLLLILCIGTYLFKWIYKIATLLLGITSIAFLALLWLFTAIIDESSCSSSKYKERLSTDLEFVSLKNHAERYTRRNGTICIGEKILVINPPSDRDSLVYMMLNYRKEHGIAINDSCKDYSIWFYRYTKHTAPYIDDMETRDFWGDIYWLSSQRQDLLGILFNETSPIDSLKWMIKIGIAYEAPGPDNREDTRLNVDYLVLDSCAVNYDFIDW